MGFVHKDQLKIGYYFNPRLTKGVVVDFSLSSQNQKSDLNH